MIAALMLFNVSFGILVAMPLGWLFMAVVVLLESYLYSMKLYGERWKNIALLWSVIANVVSGLAGFWISLALNGGWWLVVWFPWVSSNEVKFSTQWGPFLVYYLVAYILTVIIEGIVLHVILGRRMKGAKIWRASVFTNTASYVAVSGVMYFLSFVVPWR